MRGTPQSRSEFMAGQICAVLANIHRNEKAVPSTFTPYDFMPVREHEEAPAQEAAPATPADDVDLAEITRQLERMLGKGRQE